MSIRIISVLSVFALFFIQPAAADEGNRISVSGDRVIVSSGVLQKQLRIDGTNLLVDSYLLDGKSLLGDTTYEIALQISKASPNEQPLGIDETQADEIRSEGVLRSLTDELQVVGDNAVRVLQQNVTWVDPIVLQSDNWKDIFRRAYCIVSEPKAGVQRLNIRFATLDCPALPELTVNIYYEICEGHQAIRKWVAITNHSAQWLKIDKLMMDGLAVSEGFRTITDLTPGERGATTSIRSYSNADKSAGIIVGSEVPSAPRVIAPEGRTGYSEEWFEWVIGPAERFVSEPVFHYAYSGETYKTISAVSTTLDRTVERLFQQFLYDCVGVKRWDASHASPHWCSWTNIANDADEHNIAEMVPLAARCGFRGFMIATWGTRLTESSSISPSLIPNKEKFSDFDAMMESIRSAGLDIALWVCCFRLPTLDPDFTAVPNTFSLPKIHRGGGVAMSYASKWRYYYAEDVLKLRDRYGATYIMQDLTNIKFGDISRFGDSRTLEESYLRGLRGLFEAHDIICEAAPDVILQLTHEILWGTPGVPCDIASLKHAHTFHIPPNDYSGAGHARQRPNPEWADNPNYAPEKLRADLIRGCFNARNRFYAHRGLPLQSIEYYGVATMNFMGSLTPDVQRRQVCSWLFGRPNVVAGDLATLTEENIETYRENFALIGELNKKYGIYQHFQYSGVPAPTDDGWHWWGKLNEERNGAVVVIRGRGGENERNVNIPWVDREKRYQVISCFSKRLIGNYTGSELIEGKLLISLPTLGQDILEIRSIAEH